MKDINADNKLTDEQLEDVNGGRTARLNIPGSRYVYIYSVPPPAEGKRRQASDIIYINVGAQKHIYEGRLYVLIKFEDRNGEHGHGWIEKKYLIEI